jgi:hypothetical protein
MLAEMAALVLTGFLLALPMREVAVAVFILLVIAVTVVLVAVEMPA